MDMTDTVVIKQHLIDREICIRCNNCEATCPAGAVTHDSRKYVVDAAKCKLCMVSVPPCPTGPIDNRRTMPRRAGATGYRAGKVNSEASVHIVPRRNANNREIH